MENELKSELIIAAASNVHENWCVQELQGFYKRAVEAKSNGASVIEALKQGCYKGEQKRNEFFQKSYNYQLLYPPYDGLIPVSDNCLDSFDEFKNSFDNGEFYLARFAKRALTEDEKKTADISNYKEDQENILRPFIELSRDSKKENLSAAIGAVNVYEELSKAGFSIEQMQFDPKITALIGIAIHADWLKRNKEHPNESLKVPFSQLDEWTQQQDLTVFGAVLSEIKKNREKYFVSPVDGFALPDYEAEEKAVLGANL